MLKDRSPQSTAMAVRRSRVLRRTMTLPEILVWQVLRHRPSGLKFRRQHPTDRYILDSYCSDARLAIEIDGEMHGRGDHPIRDAHRDEALQAYGIVTLRIAASAVLADIDAAIGQIVYVARARLPLHHPARPDGPPPRDELGEE